MNFLSFHKFLRCEAVRQNMMHNSIANWRLYQLFTCV